jgi:hypothetical protein
MESEIDVWRSVNGGGGGGRGAWETGETELVSGSGDGDIRGVSDDFKFLNISCYCKISLVYNV